MSTLILSDTHLGRPYCGAGTAAALRPLWDACHRVVVNGDVAEIHHRRHGAAACREVLRLQELCEDDGVDLTLLSGNHDPFLSDIRHLALAGGEVFVTHGDVLHPSIVPWSPYAARMRAVFERAVAALSEGGPADLSCRLAAAQHAAHVEWLVRGRGACGPCGATVVATALRPWLGLEVLRSWRRFPSLAAAFVAAHAPAARYVVLGHTHHPAIDAVRGRTVINTGCYGFPGAPRAVVIDAGTLAVRRIRRRRGGYALGGTVAEFELEKKVEKSKSRKVKTGGGPRPSLPV